jgi:uncharacterized membrane protein
MKQPSVYKKIFQFFLQGLLILAPIAITFWAITSLFIFIDGILPNLLYGIVPKLMKDAQGNVRHITGLGFVVVILLIVTVGYVSSNYIFSKVVDAFDKLLEKTPGIKFIYSTLKEFFEAFAGEKKKFTNNVLANVDDNDVWRVGFITQENMEEFGLPDYVAVYVPMSYSVAGSVYIIPKERVKPITNISAAQTMKFAVSGGVTHLVDNVHFTQAH